MPTPRGAALFTSNALSKLNYLDFKIDQEAPTNDKHNLVKHISSFHQYLLKISEIISFDCKDQHTFFQRKTFSPARNHSKSNAQ